MTSKYPHLTLCYRSFVNIRLSSEARVLSNVLLSENWIQKQLKLNNCNPRLDGHSVRACKHSRGLVSLTTYVIV